MANEETKQNDEVQVVAFKLRDEEYGVSILNVQEIRNMTDITRVPFAADFIKGVINLRGSVLPVIDLKKTSGTGGNALYGKYPYCHRHH
jgi:purine-binding chemotaxis protein CheW